MRFNVFTKDGLHYLNPVYQLLLNSEKMKAALGQRSYQDNGSQWISFSGDYQTSNSIAESDADTLSAKSKRDISQLIESYKGARHVDARKYILEKAESYRIVMINEAHHNPSHRAFTFSLLEDFYKMGFRYLAMETFNNHPFHTLDKLTSLTGTYILEPIGGELVRHALKLGYQLVSYEDTVFTPGQTATQRDSAQANHLYQVLQKDPLAKMLVHAGYGHIMRGKAGDYIPLGAALHQLAGIPYLSFDQATYSEGNHYLFMREMYNSYVEKYAVTKPTIALKKDTSINLFGTSTYDLNIIHPKTLYEDFRPHWAALNGYRKKYVVRKNLLTPNTFYVQAYYDKEMNDSKISDIVPADQTYYKNKKGKFVLYLHKDEYAIVFRDANYNIIKTVKVKT